MAIARTEPPKQDVTGPPAMAALKASIERTRYVDGDEEWIDAAPTLPPGTKIALLDGDPAIPDRVFTLRMKIPAGARLMPHYHTADEHVTIVSGELHSGLGDTYDASKLRVMPPGSYYSLPAGERHYAFAPVETVFQMHGIGPWQIVYVDQDAARTRT